MVRGLLTTGRILVAGTTELATHTGDARVSAVLGGNMLYSGIGGYKEGPNYRTPDELLKCLVFHTLVNPQKLVGRWQWDDKSIRSLSGIDNWIPWEFVATRRDSLGQYTGNVA